jgi:hypothetical protein
MYPFDWALCVGPAASDCETAMATENNSMEHVCMVVPDPRNLTALSGFI